MPHISENTQAITPSRTTTKVHPSSQLEPSTTGSSTKITPQTIGSVAAPHVSEARKQQRPRRYQQSHGLSTTSRLFQNSTALAYDEAIDDSTPAKTANSYNKLQRQRPPDQLPTLPSNRQAIIPKFTTFQERHFDLDASRSTTYRPLEKEHHFQIVIINVTSSTFNSYIIQPSWKITLNLVNL